MAFTSHFDSGVISFWSSGTGAAGLLGSMSYALLTTIGLSPKNTLLVMLIIPFAMALTFWKLILKSDDNSDDDIRSPLIICDNEDITSTNNVQNTSIEDNSSQISSDLTFREMALFTKVIIIFQKFSHIFMFSETKIPIIRVQPILSFIDFIELKTF